MRLALLVFVGCHQDDPATTGDDDDTLPNPSITAPTSEIDLESADLGLGTGYQGSQWFGHLLRGRAALVGDLDGDDRQDVWLGNPGDESFVLFNRSEGPGDIRFELGQILTDGHGSWGGALADFDNDGDNDLYVTGGGNEGDEWSIMWRNQLVETGTFEMIDVTDQLAMSGPPDEAGRPTKQPTANANTADYDNDGLLDILANVVIEPAADILELAELPELGQNILWQQSPEGFQDVARSVGITSTDATQHSMSLDWDNDGDEDIYENNNRTYQHLWRNLLVETGELTFEEVTEEMSLGGGDLRYPFDAFSAAVADFNHDGWEDIIVFVRAFEEIDESPYHDGHVLLLNAQGQGFVDVAPLTGVNDPYISWDDTTFRNHDGGGVMGSSVGDVNADGIADVYVGMGGPSAGTPDLFFLSSGLEEVDVDGLGRVVIPVFQDATPLIDWPVEEDPALGITYPPYPYRTHAVNFVDWDRDGVVELSIQNGGPKESPDVVQEPSRLFQFTLPNEPRWFAVSLAGNGTTVNRSAIGSKVVATLRRDSDGYEWTLTRWLHGGNGFSANNGFELYFGLADADAVLSAEVVWADGSVDAIEPLPDFGDTVFVDQALGETKRLNAR